MGSTELPNAVNEINLSFLNILEYHSASPEDRPDAETLLDIGKSPDSTLEPESPHSYLEVSKHNKALDKAQAPFPLTDHLIIVRALGTLSALLLNASILQIDCTNIRGHQIYIPENLSTPTALTPTPLQTNTPHFPYVDLIPFPSIRDRILQSQHIINGVEIWGDITRDVKVWGNTPWDDQGWEIGERFAVKWWFLMDDEVLRTTNFWRGTRDERGLSMGEIRDTFHRGLTLEK